MSSLLKGGDKTLLMHDTIVDPFPNPDLVLPEFSLDQIHGPVGLFFGHADISS